MEQLEVVPYKDSGGGKKEQVATMFNNISAKYDFLNHFLSLGIDKVWRRKAIAQLVDINPKSILDVATGTGDFAIEALTLNPDHVDGIDISTGMLDVGKEKIIKKNLSDKITLQVGDSENIPFESNKFDAVIVAYGVRNFENLEKGIQEMFRVLRPGGKMVILEFSKPRMFPFKQLYNFYFQYVLPRIGKTVSKDNAAYTYLPESVKAFPDGQDLVKRIFDIGFKHAVLRLAGPR
jgi:demethylmenaquinone methyltransferase/2-methoxy-6-polyprenyl-1,4-benzoquinol methylase